MTLATDPVECKALAKYIPENREADIKSMREVIALKFTKEPFRTELMKIGNATLLECNPHDKFWSAGCRLDEVDPNKTTGNNQLGKLLQEHRERITQK